MTPFEQIQYSAILGFAAWLDKKNSEIVIRKTDKNGQCYECYDTTATDEAKEYLKLFDKKEIKMPEVEEFCNLVENIVNNGCSELIADIPVKQFTKIVTELKNRGIDSSSWDKPVEGFRRTTIYKKGPK